MEIEHIFSIFLFVTILFSTVSGQYPPEQPKLTPKPRNSTPEPNIPKNLPNREQPHQPQSNRRSEVDSPVESNNFFNSACTVEGFAPHPTDCTKFIRCVDQSLNPNGPPKFTRFDFDCAFGTVFDPAISTCNFPGLGQTKEGCDAKFPTERPPDHEQAQGQGQGHRAPEEVRKPKELPVGPDQRGGGHFKYQYVTEKTETVEYEDVVDVV